ncbi:hypothetical protein CHS0354_020028 [Potamilus streckersoni]|uniref:TLC domain-containing protein n=1 Tax=Potamilus streckersoni TaxID=2493646 RepID=A0AAE0VR21_9BIVA|nr:hypothetical protein CHS0354_020028 [Potamilus streckersoni]
MNLLHILDRLSLYKEQRHFSRQIFMMSFTSDDILVISLTINWCTLCFNLAPRIIRVFRGNSYCKNSRIFSRLWNLSEEKPWLFAKILTEQFVAWLLIICSIVAICSMDVVQDPFQNVYDVQGFRSRFIGAIFGVNIGRYLYMIIQNLFLLQHLERLKFRADTVHHVVTVVCYTLFLAYRQNVLLGFIGIVMELNNIFDEMGKLMKGIKQTSNTHYKRLTLSNCAVTIVFRGILPIIFLVIAMFHQSPFKMDYAPLTVFFLSIIFFSVINVWLILTTIQRFLKVFFKQKAGQDCDIELRQETHACSTISPQRNIERFDFPMARNNLGYLRAFENRNIFNNFADEEKHNLNNRKEFPKENLQLLAESALGDTKFVDADSSSNGSDVQGGTIRVSGDVHHSFGYQPHSETVSSSHLPLRVSDSSGSSTSTTVFIRSSEDSGIGS